MYKRWHCYLFGMMSGVFISQAQAENLLDVYHQALANDPTYKDAQATYLATKENSPIAWAALLPDVQATGSTFRQRIKNSNTAFVTGVPDQTGGVSGTYMNDEDQYGLTITQPLFNYQSWYAMRTASYQVQQAQATLNAATEDLMIRVAQAYFNVLQAYDNLGFTVAQKAYLKKQWQTSYEQYKVGSIAITDYEEAKANYDSVVASEIVARITLADDLEALKAITGQSYSTLSGLGKDVPLVSPQPADINQWVSTAESQNYTLLAAEAGASAAQQNIKTQFGNNLPVISTQASYQYDHNSNIEGEGFPNTQTVGQIGLTATLPVYEGGLVSSQTEQARYQYQAALSQMELAHRTVITQTRDSYLGVFAGMSQIMADRQSVISNETVLKTTESAYQAGTRTMVDVLGAQSDLFDALQTDAGDQYTYLMNTLTLKQQAGTLSENDLRIINTWLTNNINIAANLPPTSPAQVSNQSSPATSAEAVARSHTNASAKQPAANQTGTNPIAKANPSHYTLELFTDKVKAHALNYIAKNNLQNNAMIYSVQKKNGEEVYVVIYGDYATKADAEVALKQFPPKFLQLHPVIRSFASVQKEMK